MAACVIKIGHARVYTLYILYNLVRVYIIEAGGLNFMAVLYLSMIFAINSDINMKGRLGRPSLNLLDVIRKDLARKSIDNKLRSITDFENLRFMALDRISWKKLEEL